MSQRANNRILVVDDEELIRDIIAFDLERLGYEVIHASGGIEAFEKVKATPPALVVSDVRMPAGTGTDLLAWIKAWNPRSPRFIFMTAFADISADQALDLGAESFLTKPLMRDNMLEEINRAFVPLSERWTQASEADGLRTLKLEAQAVFGSGGFFLPMDDDFPSSLEIVAFDLPFIDKWRLIGQGRVRWVRHELSAERVPGIGVEIVYLDADSLRRFTSFLDAQCPMPYVPLGPLRTA